MTLINKLAKEFVDTYDNNRNDPECVKKYAMRAIDELIQVVAMIDKEVET